MRLSRRVRLILVGTSTIALLGTTAAQAIAAAPTPTPANPGYYIVDVGKGVQVGSATFFPTGHLPAHTITVVPNDDGSLPVTKAQLDQVVAAKASGDTTALRQLQAAIGQQSQVTPLITCHGYVAPYHTWSSDYAGDTWWGWDQNARIDYSFSVTEGSNQQAAGQGLGYYYGYNGSDFGLWRAWFNLGTAVSGENGGANVPWGETIGHSHFIAYSIALSLATGCFTP